MNELQEKKEKARLKKEMEEKQRQQQEMIQEKLEQQKKQSEEDSRWLEEEESKSEFPGSLLSPVSSFCNHAFRNCILGRGAEVGGVTHAVVLVVIAILVSYAGRS